MSTSTEPTGKTLRVFVAGKLSRLKRTEAGEAAAFVREVRNLLSSILADSEITPVFEPEMQEEEGMRHIPLLHDLILSSDLMILFPDDADLMHFNLVCIAAWQKQQKGPVPILRIRRTGTRLLDHAEFPPRSRVIDVDTTQTNWQELLSEQLRQELSGMQGDAHV